MDSIQKLKRIVDEAAYIVFFGGAGVSTDSGIPDFRGTGGIYTQHEGNDSPGEMLSHRCLVRTPEKFFDFYRTHMIYPDAVPNDAHKCLFELERRGKLRAVITQNIDGLHQAAGSGCVIELHGTTTRNYCMECGEEYSAEYVTRGVGVARCNVCGGIVRPDVVLYGEPLDTSSYYAAQQQIINSDVLIVGGTSLTVTPASTLVSYYKGRHLIIINKTPTPYDSVAELVIRDSLSSVLRAIM